MEDPQIDFSELYKHSGGHCSWSPDGKYLAVASNSSLVVRDVDDMSVVNLFNCADEIKRVEWSFDSMYILCGIYGRAVVDVWCVNKTDWTCRITEGVAGMVHSQWSPDGRHIVTVAEFQLHMTVWSLLDGTAIQLPAPKHPTSISFSPGSGAFAAVLHRCQSRDVVMLYDSETWKRVSNFEPETRDASDISWSTDGTALLITDCAIDYNMVIYRPDGVRLSKYVAYKNALGIKSTSWSPSGELLAVGSFDESVRVLSSATWKPIVEYVHSHSISAQSRVQVYREVVALKSDDEIDEAMTTEYIIEKQSCKLIVVDSNPSTKGNKSSDGLPKLGVGMMSWSPDNEYLATRNDSTPHVVYIWETAKLSMCAALIHKTPVRSFKWHPNKAKLFICVGTPKIFIWSPEDTSWIDVPISNFDVRGLRWNPTRSALVMLHTNVLCTAYFDENPKNTENEDEVEKENF
jgi:WD40 repeat protein